MITEVFTVEKYTKIALLLLSNETRDAISEELLVLCAFLDLEGAFNTAR